MMRIKGILYTLMFALICPLSVSAANKTYIAPAAERENAKNLTKAYQSLNEQIPKHLYDIDALAETLDYDVEAAAEFVRDDIHYDPYLGVMRGPQGTISAKAGSSWDQAVLLAGLINAMAGEAMLVKGHLNDTDVNRLLLESFGDRELDTSPLSIETVSDTLEPFVPASRLQTLEAEAKAIDSTDETSTTDINDLGDRLEKVLAEAGVGLAETSPERLETLRKNLAEEYVWVRYRDTPNEPWVDIHPTFGKAEAPDVEPQKFIADSVPRARLHQIEIRLEIETKVGDKFNRESIMTPYRRPAANLAGTQINLGIVANSPYGEGEESSYFTPVLNNGPAPGAKVFTLLGLTAPVAEAAAGPAIFKTVGEKFSGALGALNEATGVKDGAPRLSGVILDVVHISPDGTEKIDTRRLVDFRDGLPENASTQIAFKGIMDTNVGPENNARALKTLFTAEATRAKSLPYIRAYVDGEITAEEASAHPAFSADQTPQTWNQMLMMGDAFNGRVQKEQSVVRLAPMVSMLRVQGKANEDGIFIRVVDILQDETLVLNRDGDTVTSDAKANLAQGLRLTLAEQALAPGTKSRVWTDMPLQEVFTQPSDIEDWISSNAETANLKDRLLADLTKADALVLAENTTGPRWWRINAQTGQTLGMGIEGGQETTEWLAESSIADMLLGTFTATMLIKGHLECEDAYPNNKKMQGCCQLGNAILTAGSMGAGAGAASLGEKMASGAWKSGLGLFISKTTWEVSSNAIGYGAGKTVDPICRRIMD